MIEVLRKHLKDNTKLVSFLDNGEAIYHLFKPSSKRFDDIKTFIVIRDKIVTSDYLKTYAIEFKIQSPSLEKVIGIKEELIRYLNDKYVSNMLSSDYSIINGINLLNGGGIIRDDEAGVYLCVLFFSADQR